MPHVSERLCRLSPRAVYLRAWHGAVFHEKVLMSPPAVRPPGKFSPFEAYP